MDKWDKRFLDLAKMVSTWSKDPSTQTGAIIVRPDKTICSVGYNGFPMSMDDHEDLYNNRDEKYDRIIHCEMNAAMFSRDQSLQGYTLYTYPFLSCHRCFVHMLQLGITRFVCPTIPEEKRERWDKAFRKTYSYKPDGVIIDEYDYR